MYIDKSVYLFVEHVWTGGRMVVPWVLILLGVEMTGCAECAEWSSILSVPTIPLG